MNKKILIIEDDNILQQAIITAITDAGFESVSASDGDEGLAKATSEKPDLILLDLLMPKKNGWNVLTELKKNKTTEDIPVLVLTVVGDDKSVADCIEIGAAGYFIKSDYTLDEIVGKVKEVL